MKGVFTLMGTGASSGVPVMGCGCAVCLSSSPKNQRLRAAGLVQVGEKQLLVDAGPDIRQQALQMGLKKVDGLLITHVHFDHIGGVDDLRAFYYHKRSPIPCLLSRPSIAEMEVRFDYLFREPKKGASIPAQFQWQVLPDHRGEMEFCGVPLQYLSYSHSGMRVTGYRFGDLAYISDISEFPDTIFEDLVGVKTLVLSALRDFPPSPIHFTVNEAVSFAEIAGVEQCWLTHLGHELDHEATEKQLPSHVRVAYDGLELPFDLG